MKSLVLAVCLLATCHAKLYQGNDVLKNEDVGHLDPCNGDQNFTLQWKPKNIDLTTTKSVQIFFDMTAAGGWSKGSVCYGVWLPQYPDPIYQGCSPVTCDKIPHLVQKILPCPVTKGHHYHIDWMVVPFSSPIPVPPSDYKVKVELKNPDQSSFFCATGTITIVGSYDF